MLTIRSLFSGFKRQIQIIPRPNNSSGSLDGFSLLIKSRPINKWHTYLRHTFWNTM